MQVAVLHEYFKDLAGLSFEQTIVRQDHRCASAGLERSHNMLKEIELFVACLNCEIFALRSLVCSSCSKRRIGKDDVVLLSSKRIIDRVTEINMRLDSVQEKVHQRESARTRHQVLTVVSLRLDALGVGTIKNPFRLIYKPLVTANKKSARAARRISNCEFRFATRIRLHDPHDRFDQNSRREVLTGAFLSFARRFLEQAFECRAFNINI